MKNATQCAKQLAALLKKIPDAEAPAFGPAGEAGDGDDAIAVLVQSFLLWETTAEKAQAAYRRLFEHVVDYNDLRTTMPHEIAEYLGSRMPAAAERSERLRAVLRDIYLREHDVTLETQRSAGKRDLRKYVESLDGIVPYVGARLMLLVFDKHAMPVDEQLRSALVREGAADEESDLEELSAWLTRQVKASEAVAVHHRLRAWAETAGRRGAARSSVKPAAKSTTTKKKTGTTTKKTSGSSKKTTTRKKSSTR